MNQHLHRVIFNAARGERMAVHEAASSNSGRGRLKATAVAAFVALASPGQFALAQIAGDPSAPANQRPVVVTAPNGTPLVNIQTPSAGGVSRNTYRQFDVDGRGAILNNSRTQAQTQLGGWVQGNPYLANGPARIILNEVNSANPSQLRGYVEVAGQRAEVIIANPAGIQVNGGGFINASRATLTTGTPKFNEAGSLESFLVRGGTVSVEGAGLDASKTDYAAILARAIQVNAGIWASELKVVAGANEVTADGGNGARPLSNDSGSGAAPAFALDVAQLGGMYAGKITLVGTEAGVGVRNAGDIGAGAGELIVTAAGRLENRGVLQARRLDLSSGGDVFNNGTIRQTGAGVLTVAAPALSNTAGGVIGPETVATHTSEPTAGAPSTGSAGGGEGGASAPTSETGPAFAGGAAPAAAEQQPALPGQLRVAGTLRNEGGRIHASAPIDLQAPQIDNAGGTISVANLSVAGPTFSNAGGTLDVSNTFRANVGSFDNAGGTLRAGSIVVASSGNLRNGNGTLSSTGDIELSANAELNNDGSITAARNLTATAGSVNAGAGSVMAAGVRADGTLGGAGDLRVSAAQALNSAGKMLAAGNASLTGASVNLAGGSVNAANIELGATQGNVLTNNANVISAGRLAVSADANGSQWLVNQGGVLNAAQIELNAANIDNGAGGRIEQVGGGPLRIDTTTLDNSGGTLASNSGDMTVQAQRIVNQGGKLQHLGGGTLTLAADQYNGTGGQISSQGVLAVGVSGDFGHDAGSARAQTISIRAGSLGNRGGTIIQTGDAAMTVHAGGALDNTGGQLGAVGAVEVRAATLNNSANGLIASTGGALDLSATGQFNNDGGRVVAMGDATVSASGLSSAGGEISAQDIRIDTHGQALNNHLGTIAAKGKASLQAGAINNDAGLIQSAGELSVDAADQQITNTASGGHGSGLGGIVSTGGSAAVLAGSLVNDAGFVGASGNLTAKTAATSNIGGQIASKAALDWQGASLDNTRGTVQAATGALLDARSGELDNTAGSITTQGGLLKIAAGNLTNAAQGAKAALIGSGGGLAIDAAQLTNTAEGDARSKIWAANNLSVNAQGITNSAAVEAVGSASLTAGSIDNQSGATLAAGETLRLNTASFDNVTTLKARRFEFAGQQFNNHAGAAVEATDTLSINAAQSLTNDGRLLANNTLSVETGDLVNRAEISANEVNLVGSGSIRNTATGQIVANQAIGLRAPSVDNQGLINANAQGGQGSQVRIDAGAFTNTGAGTVYGDNVQIQAGTLNNKTADGVGARPLIAARQRLAIGADTLNNEDGAQLYSLGEVAIGAAVDAQGTVTGKAQLVNNLSATIEAQGALSLAANTILNERRDVQIVTSQVLDETRDMAAPSWWSNGQNAKGSNASTANYRPYVAYYVDASQILKDEVIITPDGYRVHRAEVRLSPQDSAFFVASGSLRGQVGNRARQVIGQDGVAVIYYAERADGVANPDQVPGAPAPAGGYTATVSRWESDTLTYDSNYGRCTTNCVSLITVLDYTDPVNVLNRDTLRQHPTEQSGNEVRRIAHHTAVETQLAPGAGAEARILSGGAMKIDVGTQLINRYGQIAAGGNLTIDGQQGDPLANSKVTNIGQTLTRTHSFNNTNVTAGGGSYGWTNPDITETTGQVGGSITSGGTLSILAKDLANTDAASAGPAAVTGVTFAGMRALPGAPGYAVKLPGSSLFRINAGAGGGSVAAPGAAAQAGGTVSAGTAAGNNNRPLVETDPRFTGYREWISSDYLLNNLGLDPLTTQKRLGDGFYEQQLIKEQVLQLTGRRYLDGYGSDSEQYTALLTAGVAFARQYPLTPGIALSDAQMALLTSDIVWLVKESVTLPDGSRQDVLVPRVYQAVRAGDLQPSGALLAGKNIQLKLTGDVLNSGSIEARNTAVVSAGNDIRNLGGRITGSQAVGLYADRDILNIGGQMSAGSQLQARAGRDLVVRTTTQDSSSGVQPGGVVTQSATRIDRVASMQVTGQGQGNGALTLQAGRDAVLEGAQVRNDSSGGFTGISAKRDVTLATVTERQAERSVFDAGNYYGATSSREVGATVQGNGNVTLRGDRDLNIRAGQVESRDGALDASAGNNVTIEAGQQTASREFSAQGTSKNLLRQTTTTSQSSASVSDVVSARLGGNTVKLAAGNDINAQAVQIRSEGETSLAAGRDINLSTATRSTETASFEQSETSAAGLGRHIGNLAKANLDLQGTSMFLGKKAEASRSRSSSQEAVGSTISAGSVQIVSGRDTTLQAATVVADGDITAVAGRNLTIESAQSTASESDSQSRSKSGQVGTWYNPAIGKLQGSDASETTSTRQVSSQVASLKGDVTLVAGGQYRQTASSVMALGQAGQDESGAGGNINILAKNVLINEALNTQQTRASGKSSSTVMGGSASVGGISTDSMRSLADSTRGVGNSGDGRMQALAAANAAFGAKNAYDTASSLASGGPTSYKVSVNVSRNKSEYDSTGTTTQAVGSGIVGAGNVNIVATGGGADSNIRAIGSTIAAGKTVNLAADNQVTLEASKNTVEQQGRNNSSGQSVGVGFAGGSQNGFTIELGVSKGQGTDELNGTSYNNTRVSGGQGVNITSGGDLNLKGAVVEGQQVRADVGGNLNIESLQDTSSAHSKQSSSGVNVSLCIPPICYGISTVSGNVAKARAEGDFQSVGEQSGIKAGDGGFKVDVKGDTNLKGAVIESTQAAIDAKNNSFKTGGALTLSDLENYSQSGAKGYSVSGSVGTGEAKNQGSNSVPGGGAGVGEDSTRQASVTRSGISGIAGDESVRTGDTSSAGTLVKAWDTQAAIKDVQNQAQVTQQFSQNAAREIGTYAGNQAKDLRKRASEETDAAKRQALQEQAALWDEGGAYRVALHSAAGLLSGGVGGALANGVTASAMPLIGEQITKMDLPGPVQQALGAVTAAAIGGLVGGASGASTAFSTDINNRQLHPSERALAQKLAKKAQEQGLSISAQEIEEQMRLMGNESFEVGPNSVSAIAKGQVQELVDSYLADPTMPRTVKDNFIVEVPGVPRPDIQAFITTNTTDESLGGWIPGTTPYVVSGGVDIPAATSKPSEAPQNRCANLDVACRSGVGVSQNAPLTLAQKQEMADYLGQAGTNYQRIALGAAAAGRGEIAIAYEIAAVAANALEQLIRPSAGKVSLDSAMDIAIDTIARKTGIPKLVLFEISEQQVKPLMSPVVKRIDGYVHQ